MQEPKLLSVEPNFGGTGTTVTIKGENFGECAKDILLVLICGINCVSTLKWISSKCIKVIVMNNYKARSGIGEVVVETNAGGKCLSLLTFELNITRVNVLEESDFWIDEAAEILLPNMDDKDVVPVDSIEPDPLGIVTSDISNGAKTKAAINDAINQFGVTGSSSLFEENFSVNKFLVTRHYNTSWNQLKKGVGFLRETLHIQQNKQESHSWLLNSSTVLVDMMNGLHALSQYANKTKISPDNLYHKSLACYDIANNAFSCILRQQQDIEKLKLTIKLIETYDYFFNLPSLFEKALHTKNYQSAMNNLEQVKTLLEPMPQKDKIMKFFQRYIDLLKSNIWKELTDCTAFGRIKHQQHCTFEYLSKFTNHSAPLETPTAPIDNNAPKKDKQQWKNYNEQLNYMFEQRKLIQYLNALDPTSCHLWLYICQLEKNIMTLISNSENVFIALYVRKLKQIFNASESAFTSANANSPLNFNSSFDNIHNIMQGSTNRHSLNNNYQGVTPKDEFITNNQTDYDLIVSYIDTMTNFVLNYCDNYYNEICNFMCACHYYLENNISDKSFSTNYNSSITMIVESFENYFKTLSNMLFEIELGGSGARRNSLDSVNDSSEVCEERKLSFTLKRSLTTSDSIECDVNDHDSISHLSSNIPHPVKIVLITMLSHKQLQMLSVKIASIFKVFPSLIDSIRYKEKKLRFDTKILKSVVNKKYNSLANKWVSASLLTKSMPANSDKSLQSMAIQMSTGESDDKEISEAINVNGPSTISRIFHDLMYELCQRMFLICSQSTCDRLLIAYQNETWVVCDNHHQSIHVMSGEGGILGGDILPCIRVDSHPFVTSSQSSQLNSNPFIRSRKPKRCNKSSTRATTTTQFPLDFHKQFIHWTLAISFFLNPIIHSKCLEDIDMNQLKCHDSNVRNIFMVYYYKLMETFKMVATKKIVPNNFRNNNNKNRDTIYLMIYCNVAYMLNELLPIANKLFNALNPAVSEIIPQTVELSTLSEIYDVFSEFSNTILNQYVKVKFRSVLLPIVISFSSDQGYLYSIHSNVIQSHIYNFMIRLMHFTKDIIIFKKSTHVEVMKRLCNSVAAIIFDNVNKITNVESYIVKQQIINISTLEVIFQGYIDNESEKLFKDSIEKLNILDSTIDQRVINQTISQFTQQHNTLLKSFHF